MRRRPARNGFKRPERVGRREARQQSSGLHRFKVQKPYCTPCRAKLHKALHPYGIAVTGLQEGVEKTDLRTLARRWQIEMKTFENLKYAGVGVAIFLPSACWATFSVPRGQAGWAEDLIHASGWFAVTEGHIKGRGRDAKWAKAGQLPKAWDRSKGIEYAKGRERFGGLQPGQAAIADDGEPQCKKGKSMWDDVIKARDAEWKRKAGGSKNV